MTDVQTIVRKKFGRMTKNKVESQNKRLHFRLRWFEVPSPQRMIALVERGDKDIAI